MKKIFQDAKDIEALMKEKIKKSMAEAAARQAELTKEQQRAIKVKQEQNAEKEAYQRQVRELMYKNAEEQKQQLLEKRERKDESLRRAAAEKEREQFIKREQEMIKREERLDNVARIARANAHAQHKVMLKIQADMDRSQALQDQKASLLKQRFSVRQQVNSEKTELMKKVEAMKRTGNFDKAQLAKFGIDLGSKDESQCDNEITSIGGNDNVLLTPNTHVSVKPPRRIKPLGLESDNDEPIFRSVKDKSATP